MLKEVRSGLCSRGGGVGYASYRGGPPPVPREQEGGNDVPKQDTVTRLSSFRTCHGDEQFIIHRTTDKLQSSREPA
jgi:hypothetical protein